MDVEIDRWSHSYDIDNDKKRNNAVETSSKSMSKLILFVWLIQLWKPWNDRSFY
jgi:hypothetical protein